MESAKVPEARIGVDTAIINKPEVSIMIESPGLEVKKSLFVALIVAFVEYHGSILIDR